MLSVIIPSYNEEEMIAKTAQTVFAVLEQEAVDCELIFVNDGSSDRTQEEIDKAAAEDPRVHYVMFSRNFGKEAAIFAGLAAAKGDCAAVMDCDLQHPPAVLTQMYRLWEQGYEVIEGVKRSRGEETGFHHLSTKIFDRIMTKAVGQDMAMASDFRLLDRRAVDAVLSLHEQHPFFRALSSWVGFKTAQVKFTVARRQSGSSKWSVKALIKYAISNIAGFSSLPLYIAGGAGAVCLIAFLAGLIRMIILAAIGSAPAASSGIILVMLLLAGILMLALAVIGFYLARIYDEVKGIPRYIISRMK